MKHNYFFGDLDFGRAQSIINFLLTCKRENQEGVMLINSCGGSVACLEAIYQTLVDTKVRLTTIGTGTVASAAAILLAMGDERIVLPGTRYLIHHARQTFDRVTLQGYDYETGVAEANAILERFVEMFQKTRITEDVLKVKCSKGCDWALTPYELKEYGVITKEDYKGWTDLLIKCMDTKND